MAEAMAAWSAMELGDDAIIVSTQRAAGGKGVRITAALEPADADRSVGRADRAESAAVVGRRRRCARR